MNNIELSTKLVGKLEGDFIIPAYQRGYRWNEEVKMLLNDLSEIPEGANYCLQPIVVKKLADNRFELIDGQQRLTTLLLIYKYMASLNLPFKQKFSLEYEIRKNSRVFLDELDESVLTKTADNIDEYFIIEAYRTIRDWFQSQNDQLLAAFNLYKKLGERINVIWYEIDSNEDAISLFTRLNIGKIPLTNAELVKAIFLSRNNGVVDERYQLEISTQWDTIENELHDDGFWYFITNKKAAMYPTRIELLFDLMVNKADDDRERLRTFLWFMDIVKSNEFKDKKINLWEQVVENYQRLKEWYKDSELYHKIGYIIASRQETLFELKSKSSRMNKTAFRNTLDKYIADSINFKKDFQELSYTNDYNDIEKLLLLFNVESVRQNGDKSMRFPFDKHKKQVGGWSLEHIHAQQSQGLNKLEQWNEWLDLHVASLRNIDAVKYAELIAEIEQRDERITGEQFEELFKKVVEALELEKNLDYIDALENMALLGKFDNSALNNSTFDVKRDKILQMDKQGDYIPICTRRVFLKYYTPSDKNQLHFWGEEDRKAYMKAMDEVLKPYLSIIGKEIYDEH